MSGVEVNFDGLVGPTHNYSGLSSGNVASMREAQTPSNPRLAARQGLAKMKALHDLGFTQGVLAPQLRPDPETLRALGFSGSDAQVLQQVARQAPVLLAAVSSASSMWGANAATVSPSADCADGRVHFTVANLNNKFHRSLESGQTRRLLEAMFADACFAVHPALPAQMCFGDEGAANHSRFSQEAGQAGVELFVFGTSAFDHSLSQPHRFPARQTLEASQAVARLHRLQPQRVVFAQQRPETIDQGVFHNDVIAVAHRHLLFCHQRALVDQVRVLEQLRSQMAALGLAFQVIEVSDAEVTVAEAVETYLFNSQLLSCADGSMLLVVPQECLQHARVAAYLESLVRDASSPVNQVRAFDLQQSMHNGGGPACLRLRVELTAAELERVNPGVLLSDALYQQLDDWVLRHYRDRLVLEDLADPALLLESQTALDELSNLLKLGSVYPFQQG